MNNSVKDWQGNIVGFRCWRCGEVFNSMWGETCNGCRHQDLENEKLRLEIKHLTEALKAVKPMGERNEVSSTIKKKEPPNPV